MVTNSANIQRESEQIPGWVLYPYLYPYQMYDVDGTRKQNTLLNFSSLCRATDTHLLGYWWHLFWVPKHLPLFYVLLPLYKIFIRFTSAVCYLMAIPFTFAHQTIRDRTYLVANDIGRPWRKKACNRYPSWLWNPGQTSPEVQNRGISGPTKRTRVLQKFNKKKQ